MIDAGEHERAAREFVAAVMGPDRWAELAPGYRGILIENAPTFADEFRDPDALWMDLGTLKGFERPALLTLGDQRARRSSPRSPGGSPRRWTGSR